MSDAEERQDRPEEESANPVVEKLSKRIERKRESRERGEQSVWFGLGMFGLVGWSVALPAIIGLLLGLWIDNTFESGRSWTLVLLIAGITLGCFNAWYWMQETMREPRDGASDEQEEK